MTGEIHTLPRLPPTNGSDQIDLFEAQVAFGYVTCEKRYVVVAWTKGKGRMMIANKLSFGSGSDVRSIDSSSWKAYGHLTRNELIVSLDIKNGKIGIINSPEPPCAKNGLVDFKGTLCVTDQEVMSRYKVLKLWAWKPINNKNDDPLTSTIGWESFCHPNHKPLVCSHSSIQGELILSSEDHTTNYLLNPGKKSVRKVKKPIMSRNGRVLAVRPLGFVWDLVLF
ncbi:OLC1v1000158C1 [Oldenlandia corymbosa var. corymbosa]|uniref:OLC1v1000158C1 n=1 Tax=Oldenlandia corymbosa var. corymbosa TaxID=529605 RepID=A0AAV1D316_OLDCO|nr:OLC1v1000158C1 [Oldenlandia corymbosa var. corymbosa]